MEGSQNTRHVDSEFRFVRLPYETRSLFRAFAVIALSLPASADSGDSTRSLTMAPVSKQAAPQAGAHAGRKFTLTRMKPGSFASDSLSHPIVLLVSAESTLQGGKQVINVSVSSRLDGPDGPLESVKKIGFCVTQPMVSQSQANPKPVARSRAVCPFQLRVASTRPWSLRLS